MSNETPVTKQGRTSSSAPNKYPNSAQALRLTSLANSTKSGSLESGWVKVTIRTLSYACVTPESFSSPVGSRRTTHGHVLFSIFKKSVPVTKTIKFNDTDF